MPTLVEAHRLDLEQLLSLALTDLDVVWRDLNSADDARDGLLALLPGLADLYGTAASSLAADWYDEMREAEDVSGRFRAITVEPALDRTDALARWGVGPLFGAEPDFVTAKSLVAGGFQRLVADAERDTILRSVAADPGGRGWSRNTTGKSCDFCHLLAGRGAVYSADTADFSSHDRCDCVAVPVYAGDARRVQPYLPSTRFRSDEQRTANSTRLRTALRAT